MFPERVNVAFESVLQTDELYKRARYKQTDMASVTWQTACFGALGYICAAHFKRHKGLFTYSTKVKAGYTVNRSL